MAKIAIVSDTHTGVRNDMPAIQEHQNKFWSELFFKELKERNIKEIFHLGDFFDKRQYITLKTMENTKKVFLKLLEEYDMKMTLLLGNHDVLYKNTNDINSPENLLGDCPNIEIIKEPSVKFNKILLVPWINKENAESIMTRIESSKEPYCFGHFEICGADLHVGQKSLEGLSPSIFDKFLLVLSGHYHTQSKINNIQYVGSPFEMTWNDFNDRRGFHIFDTDSGDMEFIEYKESLFFKVSYEGDDKRTWIPYKPKSIENKFVKVVVVEKDDNDKFNEWLSKIQDRTPQEFQIFDNNFMVGDNEVILTEDDYSSMSNVEIIKDTVNDLSVNDSKKYSIMTEIEKLLTEVDA